MSAISSGLVRKNFNKDHNINWDTFKPEKVVPFEGEENLTQLTTGNVKKQIISLDPCFSVKYEEHTGDIEIFTSSEKFIINSYKNYISKHAAFFVPKIFFTFRPAYCVQISILD